MNQRLRKLARSYSATLRTYLAEREESCLEQAYEIGRRAIAGGLGVLDMARLHQEALQDVLGTALCGPEQRQALRGAEEFFLESLSPFEATQRGFRETNFKLQQLIAMLEQRNVELADINRELGVEIDERKRTERALRQSEEHHRELFNQARRMEENLRSLSNQILHAQEEERKRISRELHDEVGQALTAISVTLATLKDRNGASKAPAPRHLADAQQLLQSTMETVHRFARELRPAILDELGLLPALRSCLHSFAERAGLKVRFRANPISETLDNDRKTVLFRVAQECLTNVVKHAGASRIELVLRKDGPGVRMDVADNGRSFREEPARPARGGSGHRLGLLGMRERVRLVQGRFSIKPEPGRGTTVRVWIPFQATRTPATRPAGQPAPGKPTGTPGPRASASPAPARIFNSDPKHPTARTYG